MDRCQRAEGIGGGAVKVFAWAHPTEEPRHRRGRKALAEEESGWGLGLPALAEGLWRARRFAGRARDLAAGGGRLWQADAALPDRRGHVRPDRDGLWQRSRQATLSAQARVGRRDLVPVVLRAGRRLRRRGPADPRGEKGR